MKTFHERLQALAFESDLEQIDLAREANIDPATVNKWWNGKREPGPKNTKVLCKILECSYRWLKFGEGSQLDSYDKSHISTDNYAKITTKNNNEKDVTNSPSPDSAKFQERRKNQTKREQFSRLELLLFKQECPGYFTDLFEFIAENYGANKEGVDVFLEKLQNSDNNYSDWVKGKKLSSNDNPPPDETLISGNGN